MDSIIPYNSGVGQKLDRDLAAYTNATGQERARYRIPEVPLDRSEGSFEITDEWVVRAPSWVLQEFERELLRGARRFQLQVSIHRDLMRCTSLIAWAPAKDPRLVGVWKLV
ncbi:hypothetical protein SEA_MILANI_38 [Microbacterium phage Milani]|nr:hypothetical protein SEA_MILANI_38 [Microbacterium phage Milani]